MPFKSRSTFQLFGAPPIPLSPISMRMSFLFSVAAGVGDGARCTDVGTADASDTFGGSSFNVGQADVPETDEFEADSVLLNRSLRALSAI